MGGMTLIEHARAAGLSVRIVGARLVVKGPMRAAALANALLAAKAEVIEALRAEDPTPFGGTDGAAESRWPDDAARWSTQAREIFVERLAIGDDLGTDTSAGSAAWEVAVRESRRAAAGVPSTVASPRSGDLVDTVIDAFAPLGGLRFAGVSPKPNAADDPFFKPHQRAPRGAPAGRKDHAGPAHPTCNSGPDSP